MRSFLHRAGILIGLALVLGGCSASAPQDVRWRNEQVDAVWPEPPQQPRIRYLRSLHGPGDLKGDKDEKASGKLLRSLTGTSEEGVPLRAPYGVAADGFGRIWVTDPPAGIVHVFDLARRKVTYLTLADKATFLSPTGIAIDRERERIYVADSARAEVFLFDYAGNFLGVRSPPQGFERPAGLAVDPVGNLYVVDALAGVVQVLTPEGTFIRTLGSARTPNGRFSRPSNISVDRHGYLYVTDSLNFRIEVFGPDWEPVRTLGKLGDVPGTFARPRGVTVDSQQHVYVTDAAFDNLQIFDLQGNLLMHLGQNGNLPGEFSLPAGLYVDQFDRLYVADSFNQRVQIFQYME